MLNIIVYFLLFACNKNWTQTLLTLLWPLSLISLTKQGEAGVTYILHNVSCTFYDLLLKASCCIQERTHVCLFFISAWRFTFGKCPWKRGIDRVKCLQYKASSVFMTPPRLSTQHCIQLHVSWILVCMWFSEREWGIEKYILKEKQYKTK